MGYSDPFDKVKNNLTRIYADQERIAKCIKVLKHVKVRLAYEEWSPNPNVVVADSETGIVLNPFLKVNPKDTKGLVHVGYKRYDDWLGLDGKPFNKSKRFVYTLERLYAPTWFKWVIYKVKRFFSK